MTSMIERIAAAEQAAETMLLTAQADARTAVADGKAAREAALEAATAQERQKTRDAVAKAELDGKALSEQLHQQQLKELDETLANAARKRETAVKNLLERVEAIV